MVMKLQVPEKEENISTQQLSASHERSGPCRKFIIPIGLDQLVKIISIHILVQVSTRTVDMLTKAATFTPWFIIYIV
jgi:hypothetical protein